MNNHIVKDGNVKHIKKLYRNIQDKVNNKSEIPEQVFYHLIKVYVFDLTDFLEENLQYLLELTEKAGTNEIQMLPNYNNKYYKKYIQFNLKQDEVNFQELWDEDELFYFLEEGCMFDINANWIAKFNLEEYLLVLGVFNEKFVLSDFPKPPYTKELFLEEYIMIPVDDLDKKTKKSIEHYNQKFVKAFSENYF
ncbi:hypothetical protein [Listeria ivanovii]|uniref:hypothetical protein n=1 Tax=Listeria ivanovii TaxID=1638 RepID=UPI00190DF61B|nr:hypothetical protein [Listeria ivanovii]MBK3915319.1 hypothetical protein [Listeria ivanovii subsp. ivanovii]MBK3922447.1 hypothetical protein [Listeria ivanovii subsp. ivanovii]MBK3927607.1 hypothetical protein [Listeria ivanovii subsp. ivanovii]